MKEPDGVPGRRLKVLICAYHCAPGQGPEAEAGWAMASAAARSHDVWVITRPRFEAAVLDALRGEPGLAGRMHFLFVDPRDKVLALRRGPANLYWFYALWQHLLGARARRLHQEVGFDVVHHVTFANDWLPCGAATVPGPAFVWGPVGGTTATAPVLFRWLQPRDVVVEVVRRPLTALARRTWGDRAARRASVVLAQNHDVARRFSYARRVVVEPNAAFSEVPRVSAAPARVLAERRQAVFVGRLIGWKGVALAVDVMADPRLAEWRLDVYGEGRLERALKARVERLGLTDRVSFLGHRPRQDVMAAMREATVLLFPSMHDGAGWAVGEASAAGCPVVCLDAGGPPTLAGPNGYPVRVTRSVVADLAAAVLTASAGDRQPYLRWQADRLPALVEGWYADAVTDVSVQR